jgi:predicted RNase H-like HicB family nuclease
MIIEKGETGYGTYVPDLPCCVAAAESIEEVRQLIREAILMHIARIREQGEAIPVPFSTAKKVRVA